ncbi:MAG: glutathione S-transferase N-terminal domain-containing protein [Caulobacter sp.]|nr:glutathione S-transferase N-terminal domain-containing protein [Caulobacter sp.]
MKLYWHPVSLMPWRVRIALAEKGLAYEEVVIDLPGGGSHQPEFLALNPSGRFRCWKTREWRSRSRPPSWNISRTNTPSRP